jgi:hypothetical protein
MVHFYCLVDNASGAKARACCLASLLLAALTLHTDVFAFSIKG